MSVVCKYLDEEFFVSRDSMVMFYKRGCEDQHKLDRIKFSKDKLESLGAKHLWVYDNEEECQISIVGYRELDFSNDLDVKRCLVYFAKEFQMVCAQKLLDMYFKYWSDKK